MKSNLSVLLLGAALLTPFGSPVVFAQNAVPKAAPAQDETACALARLISAGLKQRQSDGVAPEKRLWTWYVSYEPQYDMIKVQRGQAVLVPPTFLPIGVPESQIKPVMGHPAFGFHVQPFVSPTDYRRFQIENTALSEQLGKMAEQMRDINPDFHNSYVFIPRNEEQKKRVEAYHRVQSSLHDLPDFSFRNISLSCVCFSPDGFGMWRPFRPFSIGTEEGLQGWQREQAEAERVVTQLLAHHDAPQK